MSPFLVAVALDGAGWHPAAWRSPTARADELFSAGYWVDLVTTLEAGGVDLVTFEDSLALQPSKRRGPDGRTDQVRGRLDATQIAARVAPVTTRIGLVPTVVVTHTEPFHVASAISTLDHISDGRAGWRPRISGSADEAGNVNTRAVPDTVDDLFAEAIDVVDVVRRLCDSWDDDAIIRDVASGRFVDRDRLHHLDFVGRWFSVKGPSIVPRPPQGQPLVVSLAHYDLPYRFAASTSDVVLITPSDNADVAVRVGDVRAAERAVNRPDPPLHVVADLVVSLSDDLRRLDEWAGLEMRSDAAIVSSGVTEVADVIEDWHAAGAQGVRLRPACAIDDVARIAHELVPELRRRGIVGEPSTGGLRQRFGFDRPASRYAVGR